MSNTCVNCGEVLNGRADKKFCDNYCRNQFNNKKNSDVNNLMRNVNNTLRKNRRILISLLENGEEMKKIPKDILLKKGFDFKYLTEIYTTQKGKSYHYVYDMGYLNLSDDWLLIVQKIKD
ncbi:hypothetical protein GO491_03595 [Flavobacteriaceae bacterium Ap0902]|nr:hypothetical protein [Flavobacteriaceae bacterium Ap0902]